LPFCSSETDQGGNIGFTKRTKKAHDRTQMGPPGATRKGLEGHEREGSRHVSERIGQLVDEGVGWNTGNSPEPQILSSGTGSPRDGVMTGLAPD